MDDFWTSTQIVQETPEAPEGSFISPVKEAQGDAQDPNQGSVEQDSNLDTMFPQVSHDYSDLDELSRRASIRERQQDHFFLGIPQAIAASQGALREVEAFAALPQTFKLSKLSYVTDEQLAAFQRVHHAREDGITYDGLEQDLEIISQQVEHKRPKLERTSYDNYKDIPLAQPFTNKAYKESPFAAAAYDAATKPRADNTVESVMYQAIDAAQAIKDKHHMFTIDDAENSPNRQYLMAALSNANDDNRAAFGEAIQLILGKGRNIEGFQKLMSAAASFAADSGYELSLDLGKLTLAVSELFSELVSQATLTTATAVASGGLTTPFRLAGGATQVQGLALSRILESREPLTHKNITRAKNMSYIDSYLNLSSIMRAGRNIKAVKKSQSGLTSASEIKAQLKEKGITKPADVKEAIKRRHALEREIFKAQEILSPTSPVQAFAGAAGSQLKNAGVETVTSGVQSVLEDSLYKDELVFDNALVGAGVGGITAGSIGGLRTTQKAIGVGRRVNRAIKERKDPDLKTQRVVNESADKVEARKVLELAQERLKLEEIREDFIAHTSKYRETRIDASVATLLSSLDDGLTKEENINLLKKSKELIEYHLEQVDAYAAEYERKLEEYQNNPSEALLSEIIKAEKNHEKLGAQLESAVNMYNEMTQTHQEYIKEGNQENFRKQKNELMSKVEKNLELTQDDIGTILYSVNAEPDNLDVKDIDALLKSRKIPKEIKEQLRELKGLKKDIKDTLELVREDILSGKGEQFVGLDTHMAKFSEAKTLQEKQAVVADLNAFLKSHTKKRDLALGAFNKANDTGLRYRLPSGLLIGRGSERLVDAIIEEVTLIERTQKFLTNALAQQESLGETDQIKYEHEPLADRVKSEPADTASGSKKKKTTKTKTAKKTKGKKAAQEELTDEPIEDYSGDGEYDTLDLKSETSSKSKTKSRAKKEPDNTITAKAEKGAGKAANIEETFISPEQSRQTDKTYTKEKDGEPTDSGQIVDYSEAVETGERGTTNTAQHKAVGDSTYVESADKKSVYFKHGYSKGAIVHVDLETGYMRTYKSDKAEGTQREMATTLNEGEATQSEPTVLGGDARTIVQRTRPVQMEGLGKQSTIQMTGDGTTQVTTTALTKMSGGKRIPLSQLIVGRDGEILSEKMWDAKERRFNQGTAPRGHRENAKTIAQAYRNKYAQTHEDGVPKGERRQAKETKTPLDKKETGQRAQVAESAAQRRDSAATKLAGEKQEPTAKNATKTVNKKLSDAFAVNAQRAQLNKKDFFKGTKNEVVHSAQGERLLGDGTYLRKEVNQKGENVNYALTPEGQGYTSLDGTTWQQLSGETTGKLQELADRAIDAHIKQEKGHVYKDAFGHKTGTLNTLKTGKTKKYNYTMYGDGTMVLSDGENRFSFNSKGKALTRLENKPYWREFSKEDSVLGASFEKVAKVVDNIRAKLISEGKLSKEETLDSSYYPNVNYERQIKDVENGTRTPINNLPAKDPEYSIGRKLLSKDKGAKGDDTNNPNNLVIGRGTNLIKKFFKLRDTALSVDDAMTIRGLEHLMSHLEKAAFNNINPNESNLLAHHYPNATKEQLLDVQRYAALVTGIHKKVVRTITHELGEASEGNSFTDLSYFLIDPQTGRLNDAVSSLVTASIVKWLTTQTQYGQMDAKGDIAAKFKTNRDLNYSEISQLAKYNTHGIPLTTLARSMGNEIFRSLGITPDAKAPASMRSRLSLSLGSLAVHTMLRSGYATSVAINPNTAKGGKSLNQTLKGMGLEPLAGVLTVIRVPKVEHVTESNSDMYLHTPAHIHKLMLSNERFNFTNVIELHGLTPDLLTKLFPDTHKTRPLSLSKPQRISTTLLRSSGKVAQGQKLLLNKDNQKGWELNTDTLEPLLELDPEVLLDILGYDVNIHEHIDVLQKPLESVNAQIERDITALREQHKISKQFYLKSIPNKLTRMQYDNRINPQESTLHRGFVTKLGYAQTFKKSKSRTPEQDNLLFGIGYAFDIEAGVVGNDAAYNQIIEFINRPDIIKASEIVAKIRNKEELTLDDISSLRGTLAEARGAGLGYNALHYLNEYRTASNGASITHKLTHGADGLASGVAITHMQIPVMLQHGRENIHTQRSLLRSLSNLEKFGLFNTEKTLREYRQDPLSQDPYTHFSQVLFRELLNDVSINRAIEGIIGGSLIEDGQVTNMGRKLAKYRVMTYVYQAGVETNTKAFIGDLSDIVLDKVNNYHHAIKNEVNHAERLALANEIHIYLKAANQYLPLTTVPTVEQILALSKSGLPAVSVKPERSLPSQHKFYKAISEALDVTYKDLYEPISNMRRTQNAFVQYAAAMYEKVVKNAINKQIEQNRAEFLRQNPTLKTVPKIFSDVTNEQYAQILEQYKQYKPSVTSAIEALSTSRGIKETSDSIDTGVVFGDVSQTTDLSDSSKSMEMRYKSGGFRVFADGIKGEEVGVSPSPILTMSSDAAVNASMMGEYNGLNLHDSFETHADMSNMADIQRYNETWLDVQKAYDSSAELLKMVSRVIGQGFADDQPIVDNKSLANLLVTTRGLEGYKSISHAYGLRNKLEQAEKLLLKMNDAQKRELLKTALQNYEFAVERNTMNREKLLSNIKAVNQYSKGDGDTFVVNKARDGDKESRDGLLLDILWSTDNARDLLNNKHLYKSKTTVDTANYVSLLDHLQNISMIKDSKAHAAHLSSLTQTVLSKVYDGISLVLGESEHTETVGMLKGNDIYVLNQIANTKGTDSKLLNLTRMSAGEVFCHEMVHLVTRRGIAGDITLRNQLEKLWLSARNVVTAKDFLADPNMSPEHPRYKESLDAAKARYNYIFKPSKSSSGESPHLHEFAAFGLTNEAFMKALTEKLPDVSAREPKRATHPNLTLSQRLADFVARCVEYVLERLRKKGKRHGLQELRSIVDGFMAIEAKHKRNLDSGEGIFSNINSHIAGLDTRASKYLRRTLARAQEKLVKGSPVRERFADTSARINKILNKNNVLSGLIKDLHRESRGVGAVPDKLYELKRRASHEIHTLKRQLQTDVVAQFHRSFTKVKLNEHSSEALTHAVMRTDLLALNTDLVKTRKLVTDKAARKQEVINTLLKLEKHKDVSPNAVIIWNEMAQALGHYMATGNARIKNLMLNAENIYHMVGVNESQAKHRVVSEDSKALMEQIDKLATLHALEHTDEFYLKEVDRLMDDSEGMEYVSSLLSATRKLSKEEFRNNSAHLVKGYTPQLGNDNISYAIDSKDKADKYGIQGYTKLDLALTTDPADKYTGRQNVIYLNRNNPSDTTIAGLVVGSGKSARGFRLSQKITDHFGDKAPTNLHDIISHEIEVMYNASGDTSIVGKDGRVHDRTYMVPILDANSRSIIDYRYNYSDNILRPYLQTSADFAQLTGAILGDFTTSQTSRKHNKAVFDELLNIYNNDTALNKRTKYMTLSFDSEKFQNLPASLQHQLTEQWGHLGSVKIHEDVSDLVLGYTRYSITDVFKKEPEDLNTFEKLVMRSSRALFGDKAFRYLRNTEDVFSAIASTAKDIITVKTGKVSLINMVSNITQLLNMGLTPSEIHQGFKDVWVGVHSYRRDMRELNKYKVLSNNENIKGEQRRNIIDNINRLEYNIEQNPITAFMGEGMLATIVNDVSLVVDKHSLNNRLASIHEGTGFGRYVKKLAASNGETTKAVASNLFVLKGSSSYQFMSDLAQFPDFAARILTYNKHKKDGVEHREAVNLAMQAFIDYDLHTNKGLDYTNHVGLMMFTKYIVRVQKVLKDLALDHPIRTLLTLLFKGFIMDVPYITDSLLFINSNPVNRLTNPASMLGTILTRNTASNMVL